MLGLKTAVQAWLGTMGRVVEKPLGWLPRLLPELLIWAGRTAGDFCAGTLANS